MLYYVTRCAQDFWSVWGSVSLDSKLANWKIQNLYRACGGGISSRTLCHLLGEGGLRMLPAQEPGVRTAVISLLKSSSGVGLGFHELPLQQAIKHGDLLTEGQSISQWLS